MPKIIFVHGMNGTSRSWNTIPEKCAHAGYDITALDLPGHDREIGFMDIFLGSNGRYRSGLSMNSYIDAVVAEFPADDERNVVLIGHSMGGAVISHVAQKHPKRIVQLIYVAAMLPNTGDSVSTIILDIKNENVPQERVIADFWPHFTAMKLVYQPEEPLGAVFSRSPDFDALPRAYVLCKEDDVIPAAIQERMLGSYTRSTTQTELVELPFSHFPQFDDPQALFEKIQTVLLI